MTPAHARRLLKIDACVDAAGLRRAFLAAAKRAHPDLAGGDDAAFRQVVEAYERLSRPQTSALPVPPAADELRITPHTAIHGGEVEHAAADGRTFRIRLPAGVRAGDRVRAGDLALRVSIASDGDLKVRGDDLWLTLRVMPRIIAEGGRIAIDTPTGKRIVWVTRKAGELGLLRLAGQGLPARASRKQGHLFVQLEAHEAVEPGGARALLRRFAAAWAA